MENVWCEVVRDNHLQTVHALCYEDVRKETIYPFKIRNPNIIYYVQIVAVKALPSINFVTSFEKASTQW